MPFVHMSVSATETRSCVYVGAYADSSIALAVGKATAELLVGASVHRDSDADHAALQILNRSELLWCSLGEMNVRARCAKFGVGVTPLHAASQC
jgi:hypothetical protein